VAAAAAAMVTYLLNTRNVVIYYTYRTSRNTIVFRSLPCVCVCPRTRAYDLEFHFSINFFTRRRVFRRYTTCASRYARPVVTAVLPSQLVGPSGGWCRRACHLPIYNSVVLLYIAPMFENDNCIAKRNKKPKFI